MAQILKSMTVQEAARLPGRVHFAPNLGKWEREFNQPLECLPSGHVINYENERRWEADDLGNEH
jgi:hypothetical protein